jgi:DNA-binding PadR family transcriptional regulator
MERKLLLLGILRQQEMHGYQLYEFIERDLSACTDIKKPTAYYMLNKMAEDGWVTEAESQEGNRPPRKVYSLTEKGEAAFQRLLYENLATYSAVYFPGDIGLAFLDSLDAREAVALLEQRRVALAKSLADLQAAPKHSGSLQLVLEHRARHLAEELAWLDEVIEHLLLK